MVIFTKIFPLLTDTGYYFSLDEVKHSIGNLDKNSFSVLRMYIESMNKMFENFKEFYN